MLEGIGLASDPDYSIANECYPYVARRLLTDPSPESRQALEQMLYGKDGAKRGRLSVKELGNFQMRSNRTHRLRTPKILSGEPEVIEKETGNKEATATTTTASALPKGAKQVVELALSPEGGPAQDIARFVSLVAFSSPLRQIPVSTIFSAPLRALEEVEKNRAERNLDAVSTGTFGF